MNKLIINNTVAIIDDNQVFPFTHKINDLDDFTIIGLPSSKTIELPRCQQNDEILGHIGEITRFTFNLDNDDKIGMSFNQTKKCSYTLLDGSEVISEGNVIVESITENNYEVTLYDQLITKIEELSGSEDNTSGYLSDLDLYYTGTNDKIEFPVYASSIPYYAAVNKNLKYTLNVTDDNLTDTSFRCIDSTTSQPATFELNESLTQLQARSVKAYDAEYAVPVNGVIESINKKHNDIIEIDSKLESYFDELHLHCGKAKNYNKVPVDVNLKWKYSLLDLHNSNPIYYNAYVGYPSPYQNTGVLLPYTQGSSYYIPLKDLDDNWVTKKAGKYYLELPLKIKLEIMSGSGLAYRATNAISWFNGKYCTNTNISDGEKFGQLYFKTRICNYTPQSSTITNLGVTKQQNVTVIDNEINFTKGVSATITRNNTTGYDEINCSQTIVLEYDFNPLTESNSNNLAIELDVNYPQKDTCHFFKEKTSGGTYNYWYWLKVDLDPGAKLTITPSDKIQNGDIIGGKNIYPKVSIKDFLLNLCKYHNLKIEAIDGKIKISKKYYTGGNNLLNIVSINNMNTKLFEFSKLQLSYQLPSYDLINKNYLEVNNKKYGEKTINTNYSIKKNVKKIDYATGVPALIKDTSKLAYDTFGQYYNAGRSKNTYGVTKGFTDKTVFGFLYYVDTDKKLYLTNDTWYEAGCKSTFETAIPTESKIVKTNLYVVKTGDVYTFTGNSVLGVSQAQPLTSFYTLSPYKFDANEKVVKSLEINKPLYNYANITDDNYEDAVTHYDKYLKKSIEDRYNVNSHILDCDIYFNETPDVYKIYNHKNVNYIISELSEYDPSGGLAKGVKLLKVNDVNNYLYPYGIEEGALRITNISSGSQTTLTVNSIIDYTGGDTIIKAGVKWGVTSSYLYGTMHNTNPANTYTNTITGLTKNTLYYVQPWMESSTGIISYGDVTSFRTLDDYSVPTVNMLTSDVLTYTTADVVAEVQSQGGYSITNYGFVYSTSPNPTLANSVKQIGTSVNVGSYATTITGLTANTAYYVKAYAINQNGTAYSSNTILLTTNAYTVPTLSTVAPYAVRVNDGYSGGTNINNGGQNVTAKGVVIQIIGDGTPTVTNNIFISNDGTGSTDFYTYFDELRTNEAFEIRSYATNSVGTGYGQVVQFATSETIVPEVYISPYVENITINRFLLTGQMIYDGGEINDIEEYGFVVSSTENPPVVDDGISNMYFVSGPVLLDGDYFQYNIDDLSPDTTYYIRAFVSNSVGIGYSEVITTTTLSDALLVDNVVAKRPNNYDYNMYVSFNINTTDTIIQRGFVFSGSVSDPYIGDNDTYTVTEQGGTEGPTNMYVYNPDLGAYFVGEIYVKAFIELDYGYVYSEVAIDEFL